jgi:hypothetical protein
LDWNKGRLATGGAVFLFLSTIDVFSFKGDVTSSSLSLPEVSLGISSSCCLEDPLVCLELDEDTLLRDSAAASAKP